MYEVWSDDDFHIDIFNQLIIDEFGTNSYAIKEAWKKYVVSDWGGGGDAMNLINKNELLSPFTGTIEAGNRYGWCTEAYIENETLGMNAPGMVNVATSLIDKFASNVGYFDSIVWAKFYGAMYSLAYFETDVVELMEKAKEVLPNLSYPKKMYDYAFEAYNKYPNDYQKAAIELTEKRRMLYRIDNIQTDPNVNGGFAILSWLYGKNSYLETCKYASMIGYDGDCTAAITQGIMGILKGFKESNEEYSQINEKIYYNGKGIYYNDKNTGYPPHIKGDYPTRQKIDDIVRLYQTNFEKILLENGGEILKDSYLIPTTNVYKDHSYLFENYDAENRDTSNYESKNGTLQNILETENVNSHTGYAYFQFNNLKNGEVYPCMGCRSFLTVEDSQRNADGSHKFYGRFNQGVVTINLVDAACSSNGDMDKFWDILEERLELCHRALRCRHERLKGAVSDVAPILWQHGALARLKKGEKIDKLLCDGYSTISLGYAGLYEMCVRMTGKSHTSDEGKEFALKVMQKLNDKCNEWKAAENISYSVYGTPMESTTYKFAKCLQKRFGIIPGVTDKNYITNSYHVHVTEEIDAFSKLAFESEFQKLSPGGAISYIEVPNMQDNIPAVLSVMKFIYDNIMYAELNTKSDYCECCGYDGEIQIKEDESGKLVWECPNCGNTDQDHMFVARRTCGYIGTQFWNQGRTQEIKDRVLHL